MDSQLLLFIILCYSTYLFNICCITACFIIHLDFSELFFYRLLLNMSVFYFLCWDLWVNLQTILWCDSYIWTQNGTKTGLPTTSGSFKMIQFSIHLFHDPRSESQPGLASPGAATLLQVRWGERQRRHTFLWRRWEVDVRSISPSLIENETTPKIKDMLIKC